MSKTAIIVGCGPFISTSLAKWLAPNYSLGLISRKQDSLEATTRAVHAINSSATVHTVAADAASPSDLTSALDTLAKKLGGKVDVLIYNAARVGPTDLLTLTADEFITDVQISAVGTLTAGQWFAKHHDGQADGKALMIVTGGTLDRNPHPAYASLSAAKSASQSIAKMLADVLPEKGIFVGTPLIVEPVIPKEDGSGYQTKSNPDVIVEKIFKPFFDEREKGVGKEDWTVERIW